MTINNSIDSLNPTFRIKFDPWWAEVTAKYPNAVIFEARRSQERQNRLYAQGRTRPGKIVTRTLTSNHRDGNAVDVVFRNNGKLEWIGPYNDLIDMAKKYGIKNLKPRETCHFEDDGTAYEVVKDPLIQALIDDGIWNGVEGEGMTKRIGLVIAKLYNKLRG